jgi:hypothetical protein
MLMNRYIPQKKAYQIWNSFLGGDKTNHKGGVYIEKVKGMAAINYVIKYIGKSIKEPFITSSGHNAKSYLCSTDINRNFKLTRSVKRFYIQCIKDSFDFQDYIKNLDSLLYSGGVKVFQDNVFCYDFQGEKKIGRSILIQT